MQISRSNENGVIEPAIEETVASRGRSYAAVRIALCEDGFYRQSVSLRYSYGGFGGPIDADATAHATVAEARIAGLTELLKRWHKPFPPDPQSVHDELADLHRQITERLQQPSLF